MSSSDGTDPDAAVGGAAITPAGPVSAASSASFPDPDTTQAAPAAPVGEDATTDTNVAVVSEEPAATVAAGDAAAPQDTAPEPPAAAFGATGTAFVPRARHTNLADIDERYRRHSRLGLWPWGVVYKAEDLRWPNLPGAGAGCASARSHKFVAIKSFFRDNDGNGMPRCVMREICLLRTLSPPHWQSAMSRERNASRQGDDEAVRQRRQQRGHEGIIALLDVVVDMEKVYLVYEFLPMSLRDYLASLCAPLEPAVVRDYSRQLCLALQYCHEHGVLYRDVRPDSIRMRSNNTKLILSDFKFAKALCPPAAEMTPDVGGEGTLWYRAPEALLGSSTYSIPVDVWALGTTICEIASKRPLLPGTSNVDQLMKIFQCRGTPHESNWKGVSSLPNYLPVCPEWPCLCLSKFVPESVLGKCGLAMLEGMLSMDPTRRLLLADALMHPYLHSRDEELAEQMNENNFPPIFTPTFTTTSTSSAAATLSSVSVPTTGSSAAEANETEGEEGEEGVARAQKKRKPSSY